MVLMSSCTTCMIDLGSSRARVRRFCADQGENGWGIGASPTRVVTKRFNML
jgi:hypothetical protein